MSKFLYARPRDAYILKSYAGYFFIFLPKTQVFLILDSAHKFTLRQAQLAFFFTPCKHKRIRMMIEQKNT